MGVYHPEKEPTLLSRGEMVLQSGSSQIKSTSHLRVFSVSPSFCVHPGVPSVCPISLQPSGCQHRGFRLQKCKLRKPLVLMNHPKSGILSKFQLPPRDECPAAGHLVGITKFMELQECQREAGQQWSPARFLTPGTRDSTSGEAQELRKKPLCQILDNMKKAHLRRWGSGWRLPTGKHT